MAFQTPGSSMRCLLALALLVAAVDAAAAPPAPYRPIDPSMADRTVILTGTGPHAGTSRPGGALRRQGGVDPRSAAALRRCPCAAARSGRRRRIGVLVQPRFGLGPGEIHLHRRSLVAAEQETPRGAPAGDIPARRARRPRTGNRRGGDRARHAGGARQYHEFRGGEPAAHATPARLAERAHYARSCNRAAPSARATWVRSPMSAPPWWAPATPTIAACACRLRRR